MHLEDGFLCRSSIPQRLPMSLAEVPSVLLEEFQLLPSGVDQHFFHFFNGFRERQPFYILSLAQKPLRTSRKVFIADTFS